MLILAAILVALLVPLTVLGLSFTRVRGGYLWLICLLGAVLAWVLVIATRSLLPIEITLTEWESDFYQSSLTILVDGSSWPFAVAVMTLPLASLLVDVSHIRALESQTWASSLALAGVGLISVVAGNPLTLLMAWAIIDIAESAVLLLRVYESKDRERVAIAFSVRVLGLFFLIFANLQANSLGMDLTFSMIPPAVAVWLLLTAGLRLGAFPLNQPSLQEPYQRRSLGTLIRLVPVVASLVLMVRVASIGVSGLWLTAIMVFSVVTAFSAALSWFRIDNELQGRSPWILVLGAMALVSSAQSLPSASMAWGLALLFSGALLFLFSTRNRWLLVFPILGVVGFSALPLAPSWEGSALFGTIPWYYQIPLFVALAFLMLGYLRHSWRIDPQSEEFERWMWVIYPVGLALLPIAHFGLIYLGWEDGFWEITFQTPGWWGGLIPLGITAILLGWNRRGPVSLAWLSERSLAIFSFDWVFAILGSFYQYIAQGLYLFTRLLEGEGGILWALVLLMMVLVTISIWGSGGGLEF